MSAEQDVLTWKVIPQTCGIYEVSNFGDIRERASGKILTVSQNSKGYAIVSLSKVGKLVKVHSVVAEMFVPKPTGDGNRLPPLQVDHIDGARMNNDARNLRWVTASENRKNAHRRGSTTSGRERKSAGYALQLVNPRFSERWWRQPRARAWGGQASGKGC